MEKRNTLANEGSFAKRDPRNPKGSPDGAKMRAQCLKGSPWGPKIGNNDKREDEEPQKVEELKNAKTGKLHNVALVRFTAAGIKINCHPKKKTRHVIKKRQ